MNIKLELIEHIYIKATSIKREIAHIIDLPTFGVTKGPEGMAAWSLGRPKRNLICVIMMVKAAAAV
jgi:hypothetical protein